MQARVLRHLLALQNETAVVMNTGPPVLEGQTYKPVNPGGCSSWGGGRRRKNSWRRALTRRSGACGDVLHGCMLP